MSLLLHIQGKPEKYGIVTPGGQVSITAALVANAGWTCEAPSRITSAELRRITLQSNNCNDTLNAALFIWFATLLQSRSCVRHWFADVLQLQ